jgi:hypothetical protein
MKMIKILKITISFFMLMSPLLADEIRYLVRSPRALLMGDAFTAIANDEYTLFYNPAALGFNKGIKFIGINPEGFFPNILDASTLKKFTSLPSDATKVVESFMGFPANLHIGVTPTIKMEKMALSFFLNHTSSFNIKNAIHPVWGIDFIYDRGMVLGGAFNFNMAGGENAFGMSVKTMNRRGFKGNFDLFGPTILNKLQSGSLTVDSLRKALGDSASKTTYGFDLGWMYKKNIGKSEFGLGLSIMDVFDTQFTRIEGSRDLPDQSMRINVGGAWTSRSTLFDYTIALDLHPINETLEISRVFHLGVNLAIPFLEVLFGWNGGYLSYGASFNMLLGKLTAGVQGVEFGTKFRQLEAKRIIFYWSFIDLAFGN